MDNNTAGWIRPFEKYLALFFLCVTGLYAWHTARLLNYHAAEARTQKAAEIKDKAKSHKILMEVFKAAEKNSQKQQTMA